jgi:hypothetical protein
MTIDIKYDEIDFTTGVKCAIGTTLNPKPLTLNDVLILKDADFNILNTFQKDARIAGIIPRFHGCHQPMIV